MLVVLRAERNCRSMATIQSLDQGKKKSLDQVGAEEH